MARRRQLASTPESPLRTWLLEGLQTDREQIEHPSMAMLRHLLFGGGDVPALTREVVRKAEPDLERRPRVHVS